MKRLSRCNKQRLIRLAKIRANHKSSRIKKKVLIGYILNGTGFAKKKRSSYVTVKIVAPISFNLYQAARRQNLIVFIDEIKRAIKANASIRIDFSHVKRLNPCGTILFIAELMRIIELKGNKQRVTCTLPKDKIVEQLFKHVGILDLLGCRSNVVVQHETVKHWTLCKGDLVDLSGLKSLKDKLDIELGEERSFALFTGIQEAITNTVHHAYIEERGDGFDASSKKWFLFAKHMEGQVSLAICDLGIGIRRSLPRKMPWPKQIFDETLEKLGANTDLDAKHIKAAIMLGATRTGLSNRGKGLHDMKHVASLCENGRLDILSNKGVYRFSKKINSEIILDHKSNIQGTIVQWGFNTSDYLGSENAD
ncbi:hypothetical protein [Chitinibacter sp. GC72]|uniref:hypothetical protein n=1 Tax=Chitinibacter sp. GC72 TaxID=1526917 RepID=UPI0012F9CB7B|nr:hypothetical protein [Chitinibacter sp. GC72]